MRVSKRDKMLLVVLFVIVLIFGYYYFLMLPQEAKIESEKIALEEKQQEKIQLDALLASEAGIDQRIAETETDIDTIAKKLYGDVTHEEILMTLEKFAEKTEFDLGNLTFINNASEAVNGVRHTANVNFTSDYFSMMDFIENIEKNSKKVAVKEIAIRNTYEDALSGNMVLEFNGSSLVEAYDGNYKKLVSSAYNYRDIIPGPFKPYETFNLTEAVVEQPPITTPEFIPEEETPIDYEDYKPKTKIYDFEDGDVFFVGNSEDIEGFVTRNKTHLSGAYSAEVVFDFVAPRIFSEANIVFENNPVVLNRQVESLSLWVFAYEASDHAIGAVVIDSKGKEYRVELATQVDWTLWQEIEAVMPVEITYPAMIQRLYIEGVGYEQKLTGKYLLDQLQVVYPVE